MSTTLVIAGSGGNNIQYSTDNGTSWYTCVGTSSLIATGNIWGVAHGAGHWVAVGNNASQTIAYSPDGQTWQDVSGTLLGGGGGGYYGGVAYGKDGAGAPQWVATGGPTTNDSPLVFSPDGQTWSEATVTGGTAPFLGTGVAFGKDALGNNLWVAVGFSGGNEYAMYSSDGQSWTYVNLGAGTAGFYGIAYGNNRWVATGQGNMYYSTTGQTWNTASVNPLGGGGGGYGITYSNGIFVAVGYNHTTPGNKIQWSPDGDVWTLGTGTLFTQCGFSVTHDSLGWIAVGNGNTNNMLFSPDGKAWNTADRTVIELGSWNAIASNELPPQPSPSVPCFVTGTQILTPTGYKAVEELQSGDYVLTAERRRVPIKLFCFTCEKATEDTAPYRIKAGTFGRVPKRDLCLSARHAVKDDKGRWQIPKYLAKYYSKVTQYGIGEPVTYYHVECPNFYRDNLVAEGIVAESYKNKQGTKGVIYMWSNSLGGWERLPPGKMTEIPKNPKNSIIIS